MNRLNTHYFFGPDPGADRVVIVAGPHNSEQDGIEVAHWIRTKLTARRQPTRQGAIVIPDVFPDLGRRARAAEWSVDPKQWSRRRKPPGSQEVTSEDFREYPDGRHPNRQFPPPGRPLSVLDRGPLKTPRRQRDTGQDQETDPLPPEIRQLIQITDAPGRGPRGGQGGAGYLPITEEIRGRDNVLGSDVPQGDPWGASLPTALIRLRADDTLPEWPKFSYQGRDVWVPGRTVEGEWMPDYGKLHGDGTWTPQ